MDLTLKKMHYILILFEILRKMKYNIFMMNKRKQEGFKNEIITVIPKKIIDNLSINPLIKNLYITDIGFFPNAKYHYRKREEGSKTHILIYCTAGKGFIKTEKKQQNLNKGDILFIPANLAHNYGSLADNSWDIYWLHFAGENVGYYFKDKLEEIIISSPDLDKFPLIFKLFNILLGTFNRGFTQKNLIYASQTLGHLLAVIYFSDNAKIRVDQQSAYVEKTIDYMQQNLEKNLSLQELADLNNLSKSQLTNVFNEKTAYSPIDFFIHLKIKKACQLLDLTQLTVKEISQKLNYNDQYYFSRIFKKIMGLAPSKYRKVEKG